MRAVGCWREAGWLKVHLPIMEIPFIQWSDHVDEDDDLGDIWPDWEPIDGDAFPGDMDDRKPEDEINFVPDWSAVDSQTYCHGTWGRTSTHGGGVSEDYEPDGRIAIYTGNWGGNWTKPKEQEHMLQDAKSNPCHILCF